MLTIKELSDLRSIQELSPQWNSLLQLTDHPDLYRTTEWVEHWWRSQPHSRNSLFVLAVFDESELVGVAPFMVIQASFIGIPVSRVEFISMGKYSGSAASCPGSLDLIIPARFDEITDAIADHLINCKRRWDFIRLHPIPKNSPALKSWMRSIGNRGLLVFEENVLSANTVHFKTDAKDYFSQLSHKFKKTLKESERKIARLGSVRFVEYSTEEKMENAFSEILSIEKRSWKWEKGVAINSTAFRDFYPNLAKTAAAKGWLSLWFLELNERKIAYGIFIQYQGRVEYLKTAYDLKYHSCSPGSLLMVNAFNKLFESGCSCVNLLAGGIEQKHRWQSVTEDLVEVRIFKNEWYSKFLHLLLYKCSIYALSLRAEIFYKRTLRMMGINWKNSELCRMDQISSNPWK